jgi:hypothetical protein
MLSDKESGGTPIRSLGKCRGAGSAARAGLSEASAAVAAQSVFMMKGVVTMTQQGEVS